MQGKTFSADQWHQYCKSKWIGCDDMTLPNGTVLTMPKSSADLDATAFAEFMQAVEAWAASHDVYLDDMEGA